MGKLTEQVRADLTESMKARTAERTSTLRLLQAAMEILKTYMPPELSDAELESGLRDIITSTGAQSKKDLGKVMKEATARYKGRAEGKKIQEIVARLLP